VIKNITTIIIIVVTMKQDGFDEYVRGCHNLNNGKKIAKKPTFEVTPKIDKLIYFFSSLASFQRRTEKHKG